MWESVVLFQASSPILGTGSEGAWLGMTWMCRVRERQWVCCGNDATHCSTLTWCLTESAWQHHGILRHYNLFLPAVVCPSQETTLPSKQTQQLSCLMKPWHGQRSSQHTDQPVERFSHDNAHPQAETREMFPLGFPHIKHPHTLPTPSNDPAHASWQIWTIRVVAGYFWTKRV